MIDSRLVGAGNQVRRRRECIDCEERFTTYETAELVMPYIIKRNGRRTPFDKAKLRDGMTKALEKRPVSVELVEEAVSHIMHKLRGVGEREVPSAVVGDLVIDALRGLDEVAYVRFASVYRQFEDVNAFKEEICRLEGDSE